MKYELLGRVGRAAWDDCLARAPALDGQGGPGCTSSAVQNKESA